MGKVFRGFTTRWRRICATPKKLALSQRCFVISFFPPLPPSITLHPCLSSSLLSSRTFLRGFDQIPTRGKIRSWYIGVRQVNSILCGDIANVNHFFHLFLFFFLFYYFVSQSLSIFFSPPSKSAYLVIR